MFESMTYENILGDMLSRVPSDIDKREGSLIYDALAPAAYKLAETYFKLENYVDLFFIDTAVGEYLDRKAMDYGITRKEARKALRKITTTGQVSNGTRWGINGLIFVVTEQIDTTNYKAECEQAGEMGNLYLGQKLDNIDNVPNVTATLQDILIEGSSSENDENLRSRIQSQYLKPAQDGNITQYLDWATKYPGIGAAKVFPLANGANTVKVAITNSSFRPAEPSLVEEFQKYIDPGSKGIGNGVAPIGCKVTVSGGVKKDINITANVVLREGYSQVLEADKLIEDYLASIVFNRDKVSYMLIGSALLDHPAILDLSNLMVNNSNQDIVLQGEEIPVLVSLNLTTVGAL